MPAKPCQSIAKSVLRSGAETFENPQSTRFSAISRGLTCTMRKESQFQNADFQGF